MKSLTIVGILLCIVGIAGFAYGGFPYTSHKDVVDLGPIKATIKEEKTLILPPLLAGLAIAGGIILIVSNQRRVRIDPK